MTEAEKEGEVIRLLHQVDQIRRRLKLAGPHRATVVLTRVDDKPWGLICADPGSPLG